MGYITNKVIDDYRVIECPNINKNVTHTQDNTKYVQILPGTINHEVIQFSTDEENISRMAIIMFWFTFVPLTIGGIIMFILNYKK